MKVLSDCTVIMYSESLLKNKLCVTRWVGMRVGRLGDGGWGEGGDRGKTSDLLNVG